MGDRGFWWRSRNGRPKEAGDGFPGDSTHLFLVDNSSSAKGDARIRELDLHRAGGSVTSAKPSSDL